MANNIAHSLRIAHIRTINQRRNPARLIGRKGRSCADQHRASRDHRERCVAVGDVRARDGVIHSNPTARGNPKALAQLDSYKRPLVGFLSANLQRFGMEKVSAAYRGLRGSVLFD
jgi:hypothetical protein